jgi:hypothetical protein
MDREAQQGCQRQRNGINERFHPLSMPHLRLNELNIQQDGCLLFFTDSSDICFITKYETQEISKRQHHYK